jgi:hypothetical protein
MYICIYIYIKVMTDGVEEIPIEYQKRPTIVSKETYYSVKRDLHIHKGDDGWRGGDTH